MKRTRTHCLILLAVALWALPTESAWAQGERGTLTAAPTDQQNFDAAKETSRKKKKRILVALVQEDATKAFRDAQKALGRNLSYEFEVVTLLPDAQGLMKQWGANPLPGTSWFSVHDASGAVMGEGLLSDFLKDGQAFVAAHRLPIEDAEAVLAGALAEAKSSKRRVLVHLGAPW